MTSSTAKLRDGIIRRLPVIVSLAVPVLILGPLYGRGYILHHDMVFAPQVHLNLTELQEGVAMYQSLATAIPLKLLSLAVPMDIVQKILLSAIFFLAVYTLSVSLPVKSRAAATLAGVLYAVNPFTYDRLMAGHWHFLLAYALTPLALRAFYDLYTEPGRRRLWRAALAWSLLAVISAHHLFIAGLLFAGMAAVFVRSRRALALSAATAGAVLALNVWWILPAYISPDGFQSFGLDHYYAFATRTDTVHGIWFNMLALQGFWFGGWRSIKDILDLWPLLVVVWLLPVFTGLGLARALSRDHRRLLLSLAAAGLASLLLAAGPHPSVWELNTWIYLNIPGMSGMREPQKFLALLALAYAVAAALAFDALLARGRTREAAALGTASLTAALLLALPMLWGANGQLKTVDYPGSWHRFHAYLEQEGGRAVVLPWELYTDGTFADEQVANPAKAFFGEHAVVSRRMKMPGTRNQEPALHSGIWEAVARKDMDLLRQAAESAGAGYIMITETRRKDDYEWILRHGAAEVIIEEEHLVVVKLTKR